MKNRKLNQGDRFGLLLTMPMAQAVGIQTVKHGLIPLHGGLACTTRREDRELDEKDSLLPLVFCFRTGNSNIHLNIFSLIENQPGVVSVPWLRCTIFFP